MLDAYAAEAVATNKLVGGRQGAWVIADFDQRVLRPAMQVRLCTLLTAILHMGRCLAMQAPLTRQIWCKI